MPKQVFISHAEENREVASRICTTLEARGITCWIAPRDIPAGADWAGAIVGAIAETEVMVIVLSAEANASRHVMREVALAVDKESVVLPFRVQTVEYGESLYYYLSPYQWIDATAPPLDQHIEMLAQRIGGVLGVPTEAPARSPSKASAFTSHHVRKGTWCTVERRPECDDIEQTCKLCGTTDWFGGTGGFAPVQRCPGCGLDGDPGETGNWLEVVDKSTGAIRIRCRSCLSESEYDYDDGPPGTCPVCGTDGRSRAPAAADRR